MSQAGERPFLTNGEAVLAARAALDDADWADLVGGVESGTTALRNRDALDRIGLRPRVLVGVRDIDASASFLGHRLRVPVLLAALGDGRAIASAAAHEAPEAADAFGSIPFLAPGLAEAARRPESGPWIIEVSAHDDPTHLAQVVAGAVELGAVALSVSLVPARQARPAPERAEPGGVPRRTRDVWSVVAALAASTTLPIIAKGVLDAGDARLAVANGCTAIYVSNYGGRSLDHCRGTIDVLPAVIEAVGDRAEVIVDGGFMRGTDVVKALALGARAVAVGRLQGIGLAAGGSGRLVRVLEILEDEIRIAMSLLGARRVGELSASHLFHENSPPVALPHATSAFHRVPPADRP